jgi:hypothetical protein
MDDAQLRVSVNRLDTRTENGGMKWLDEDVFFLLRLLPSRLALDCR